MLLNFTNHPSTQWGAAQRTVALEAYGSIQDLPFPQVAPTAGEQALDALAHCCTRRILAQKPAAVLCQGECTLSYRVIQLLLAQGMPVLAACSVRQTVELRRPDGSTCKQSIFVFAGFRRYDTPR